MIFFLFVFYAIYIALVLFISSFLKRRRTGHNRRGALQGALFACLVTFVIALTSTIGFSRTEEYWYARPAWILNVLITVLSTLCTTLLVFGPILGAWRFTVRPRANPGGGRARAE